MQEENPVFREGTYHLMTLAEYSRPNRVGYANQAASCNAPVKVGVVVGVELVVAKVVVVVELVSLVVVVLVVA